MGKKRLRANGVLVRLSDDEKRKFESKVESLGIKNKEAFARKLLLDGYIIQVDMKPVSEIVRLVKNMANNINQVAKRANETGSVYENDVEVLIAALDRLKPMVVEAHKYVAKLHRE